MKLQIEYIHNGVSGTVTTIPADVIKWERVTKQKFSDLWDKETLRIGIGDLACLVWAVLTRQVVTAEPFETWQLGLDEIVDFGEPEVPKATETEVSNTSDSSTSSRESSLHPISVNSTGTTYTP